MYETTGIVTPPREYFRRNKTDSHKLISEFKDPRDNYLWIIMMKRISEQNEDKPDRFVIWLFNGAPGCVGCHDGHYFMDELAAYKDYHKRVSYCFPSF